MISIFLLSLSTSINVMHLLCFYVFFFFFQFSPFHFFVFLSFLEKKNRKKNLKSWRFEHENTFLRCKIISILSFDENKNKIVKLVQKGRSISINSFPSLKKLNCLCTTYSNIQFILFVNNVAIADTKYTKEFFHSILKWM